MSKKRYYGASVLDPNGDMWVIGGTANSFNADSTEVYQYKPRPRSGTWRKGHPLPTSLRDTGIESQCTVRINSSHVFMAGGMYQCSMITVVEFSAKQATGRRYMPPLINSTATIFSSGSN